MSLHGNWIDLILIVFIAAYSYKGTKRGFLVLVAEMISFILSFALSLHFYQYASAFLSSNFSLSHNLGTALGFILVALVSELTIASLFTQIYKRFPAQFFHSSFNHVFGLIPAAIDGLILSAFIMSLIVTLPISSSLKSSVLSSRIGSRLVSQTRQMEQTLNQIFGGAVGDSLSFLTVKTGSSQNIDLHFRTSDFSTDTSSEIEMLTLVNQERSSRHLRSLILDIKLQSLARLHSQDMLRRGYFSHVSPDGKDPFDRMNQADIFYQTAGENLAYAPTTQIAHDGLMNSPGHRANILNPDFGHIGIGVIDAGIYGKMFTQEFTN